MHDERMTPAQQTYWIAERARALGFDLCGVTPASAEHLAELSRLPEWLDRGYAGEMRYLNDPRRSDPRRALDGARSVIVVAINYNTSHRAAVASVCRSRRRRYLAAGFRATPGVTITTMSSAKN